MTLHIAIAMVTGVKMKVALVTVEPMVVIMPLCKCQP